MKTIYQYKGIKIQQTHRENGSLWAVLGNGISMPLSVDEDGDKYAYLYDDRIGESRFEMVSPEEWDKL